MTRPPHLPQYTCAGDTIGNQTSQANILPSKLRPSHLPPEIWLSIFSLRHHDPHDLRSITLAQRSFRLLAQPFIFRSLEVTTLSSVSPQTALQNRQSRDYIARFDDRLNFIISSRDISNAIQKIAIRCDGNADVDGSADCTEIHSFIFAALHHFPNLSRINVHSVHLTTEIITQVFALPNLLGLDLEWCRTDTSVHTLSGDPRSRAVELSYTEVESEVKQVGPVGDPWWLQLLSRDTTKKIRIPQPHIAPSILRFLSEGPPMKELVALTISSGPLPLFVAAMSQCPNMDNFTLSSSTWTKEQTTEIIKELQARGALPGVAHVAGPVELVFSLLQTPECVLKSIEVTIQMEEEDSLLLVKGIRDRGIEIVSLKLDIRAVGSRFISEVLALPTLERLEVVTRTLIRPWLWGGYHSVQEVWRLTVT